VNKAELVEEIVNQTGQEIQIPAKRIPKLKPGKNLRERVK